MSKQQVVPATTGDVRIVLASCLDDVRTGKLDANAVRGIVGLANQISTSIAVELKKRQQDLLLGRAAASLENLGALSIGGENTLTAPKQRANIHNLKKV